MTYDEQEEFRMVQYRMDNEGFEYCFLSYSSFPEVKDEKFHLLRKELIEKIKEMRQYVEDKCNEEIDYDDEDGFPEI
jgi:hypothetical protein